MVPFWVSDMDANKGNKLLVTYSPLNLNIRTLFLEVKLVAPVRESFDHLFEGNVLLRWRDEWH